MDFTFAMPSGRRRLFRGADNLTEAWGVTYVNREGLEYLIGIDRSEAAARETLESYLRGDNRAGYYREGLRVVPGVPVQPAGSGEVSGG